MTQLEGSTLILILALAALAVMIVVCTVLLAPYSCARGLYRVARRRPPADAAPRQLSPRFHS